MTFLQEFQQLLLTQPRYNLKQVSVENCDYADTVVKSKNCYYTFGAFYCEDVYYGRYSRKCKDCSGVTFCANCDWCVDCVDCVGCYMVDYSQHCQNCTESKFCVDCFGCMNCFGCVGLYKKQYCFFNQQLTKEEYEKQLAQVNLNDVTEKTKIMQKIEELKSKMPNLGIHQFRTENCIGDNLSESKNCYQCYDSFSLEDCNYCIETNGNKDCTDLTVCFESENCYNCIHSPLNYNSNFLYQTDQTSESEFCAYSKNLKNCFGCAYLSNKQFYILNKPYGEQDYLLKIAEIKKELMQAGRYNLLPYFTTQYELNRLKTETDSVIQSSLPDNSLTQSFMSTLASLVCKNPNCKKPFKVIDAEQKFYQKKGLPMPDFCPACRHQQRMALRAERKLYGRKCDKCQQDMLTTYPPEATYKIYCQKCFWDNIG